jgi:hypothetical protein
MRHNICLAVQEFPFKPGLKNHFPTQFIPRMLLPQNIMATLHSQILRQLCRLENFPAKPWFFMTPAVKMMYVLGNCWLAGCMATTLLFSFVFYNGLSSSNSALFLLPWQFS